MDEWIDGWIHECMNGLLHVHLFRFREQTTTTATTMTTITNS